MYKLWTGAIQSSLSKYDEHYNTLSTFQEGFRKDKNTMRQLHTLLNVLSDANPTARNIYIAVWGRN